MSDVLAPLQVGDRLPWRLSIDGEPQWLEVVAVLPDRRYLVHYPDGSEELLADSE